MGLISRVSSRTYRFNPNQKITTRKNAADAGSGMVFSFASPGDAFYTKSTAVSQIDLNTGNGSIGILPNHVPSFGVISPGYATIYEAGNNKKFWISSGSYSVNEDGSVTIAAEEACAAEDLDLEAAKNFAGTVSQALATASEAEKKELQVQLDVIDIMTKG